VTAVYIPIAVPARLALKEERWFPGSILPGGSIDLPPAPNLADRAPVNFRTANQRPPKDFDAGGIAARIGGTWREMDWDLYHYTGPETGPNADLVAIARLPNLNTPYRPRINAYLTQAHDKIHMTGGAWAGAFGGLTVRAEGAYFGGRPYLRVASDLVNEARRALRPKFGEFAERLASSPTRRARIPVGALFPSQNAIEWGVGADYLWRGFQPLLQVNQVAILDSAPRLLIADPETRFTGLLRKRLMGERLELEVRAVYAVDRDWWFAFPRVSYLVRDDLRVRVGYLMVGGARESLIGQFRDNDEVVFQARYSF
jgi:hypothetical protein